MRDASLHTPLSAEALPSPLTASVTSLVVFVGSCPLDAAAQLASMAPTAAARRCKHAFAYVGSCSIVTARRASDGSIVRQSKRVRLSMTSDLFCESGVGGGGANIRRSAGSSAVADTDLAAVRRAARVHLEPADAK
eukprot:scaffold137695_cov27-Tisochrysis_lutea.AAC.4